jgi:hypothetical protein
MMLPQLLRRLVIALSAGLAGCSARASVPPTHDRRDCTASLEPAIVVEVRDARTGAALAAGARGAVRDGTFVDSLTPYQSATADPRDMYSRRAANERPGVYAVEVRQSGYRPWDTSGVRVPRDVCHVRTQRLRALLAPVR